MQTATQERINWKGCDHHDAAILKKIVTRVKSEYAKYSMPFERMEVHMDILACHLNGMPLDLQHLLDADTLTFAHDIGGIRKNLNRQNGKIENHFVPRCAA